jgi:hypothetical protein
MTSPGSECTCAELEKRQVWPNDDISAYQCGSTGKVTGEPDLQSARGRISSLKPENYRSFLDIYDLAGDLFEPVWRRSAPGADMSHER